MTDKLLYELPDDAVVKELPADLTISHTHFEGMCTKMGYSKRKNKHYVLHSDLAHLCKENDFTIFYEED
jgi:hypothetical protein